MLDHSVSDHISIRMDGRELAVSQRRISGAELRALGGLPGSDEKDLYLESPGISEDRLVSDNDVIDLHAGMTFFSLPRHILAG